MASIDRRIVALEFDNSKFQSRIGPTLQGLAKLKDGLNLGKAATGLKNVASNFNLGNIASAVQGISGKFSNLGVMGVTALSNIANKAVDAGLALAKSLTIEPIMDGFREYETKLNSVQTILSNTAHKGGNIQAVTKTLGDLNTYADKTIYNFAEMTRNIGMFTAAGVDLKTSANSIKGIANLAAMSGSNSQQASTAMYQLSQAISTGTVKLMDWNSVVNAGMGGEVFQKALITTAKAHGKNVDAIIKKNGSFRESLQEGWLTSKVLTQTLTAMTGDYNEQQLRSMGYNAQQAKQMVALGKQGLEAATKVKSATQLIDTLKESVGSGWATTFEYIFGNFEEAGETFTNIYNKINGVIEGASNARNELLKGWSQLGGRNDLIKSFYNILEAIGRLVRPIQQAFRTLFPPMTAQGLKDITAAIEHFTSRLVISEEASKHLGTILSALVTPISLVIQIISAVGRVLGEMFGMIPKGNGSILATIASFASWVVKLNEMIRSSDIFYKGLRAVVGVIALVATRVSSFLTPAFQFLQRQFSNLSSALKGLTSDLSGSIKGGWDALKRNMGGATSSIQTFGEAVSKWLGNHVPKVIRGGIDKIKSFGKAVSAALAGLFKGGTGGSDAFAGVRNFFAKIGEAIREGVNLIGKAFKGVGINNLGDLVGSIFTAGAGVGIFKIVKVFQNLGDSFSSFGEIGEKIGGVFDGLTDHLKAMSTDVKANAILKIAVALGVLAASMAVIASIDKDKMAASIGIVTALMAQLFGGAGVLSKFTTGANIAKMLSAAAAMTVLGGALLIFAAAVKVMATMSWDELVRGLTGFTGILAGMLVSVKVLASVQGNLLRAGLALTALGLGLMVMSRAVKTLGSIPWQDLVKGLGSFMVILGALTLFMSKSNIEKTAATTGLSLIALGAGLLILSKAVQTLGSMDVAKITQGVAAVTVLIGALGVFTKLTSNAKGSLASAAALLALATSLRILTNVVQTFGSMALGDLAKGITGVSAALLALVVAVNTMGGSPAQLLAKGAALLVVATSLNVIASAIAKMGGLSIEQIVKGLTTLGVAMAILVVGLNAMTGALPGAAAMLIVAAALTALAPALILLGGMSIGAIVTALIALGGAILVLGGAMAVITPIVPVLLAFSAALFLMGTAIAAAGAGIALLGAGLTTLGAVGTAGLAVITAAVTAFASTLPMLFAKIGQALLSLIGELTKGIPVIMGFFKNLIIGLIDLAISLLPKISELFSKLLKTILEILVTNIPKIADAGLRLITGLLKVIAQRVPEIAKSGVELVSSLIRSIGREVPKLLSAGADMVIDLLNGIAKTIEDKSQALADAAWRIGEAIVTGMLKGLATGPARIAEKIGNMAQNALDKAKEKLGIRSPSREFYKIGSFVVEGFTKAIDDGSGAVNKSTGGMATNAIRQFSGILDDIDMGSMDVDPAADILSRFNDIVSQIDLTDLNLNPEIEITPTLNLAPARAQAQEFLGLFQDPKVTVGQNDLAVQARVVSALVEESRARKAEPVHSEPPVVNNNYHFEQTNNSPKELTTAELYRQTRNLVSLAKSKG